MARSNRHGLRVGQHHRYIHGHNNYRGTLKERLKAKLRREGDCLVWTAGVNYAGYGIIQVGVHAKPRARLCHRMAWEIAKGPIPPGFHVLHRCDNPRCCKISHLFLGTHQDNMADMVRKGRQSRGPRPNAPHGEEHHMTKLTSVQVAEIKALLAGGHSTSALAKIYPASRKTIRRIKNGTTWRYA